MSGILYVTGTPIGNLSDLSPRAVETLESVDFIAAEMCIRDRSYIIGPESKMRMESS